MARPKSRTKTTTPATAGKKAESGPGKKKNLIVIRGYEAWGAWLEELARLNGAPVTVTIEQALRDLAKKLGHPSPPERY